MSTQTSWMISFGLAKVPPRLCMPRKEAFVKISFDKVDISAESKAARKRLIEAIMEKLQQGKETYQTIRDELIDESVVSFEKHNEDGIYYVSRSSLSNHIRTARTNLGLSYVHDKTKILEMFAEGFSRKEISAAGFDPTNVYSVLLRNGKIERKYKKEIKNGISQ